MNERWKSRIRELMFYVIPDPDELVTDEVLAKGDAVDYHEEEKLRGEFRTLIGQLNDWPDIRQIVLEALDTMDETSCDAPSNGVEWQNVHDVMGRRVRKALKQIL